MAFRGIDMDKITIEKESENDDGWVFWITLREGDSEADYEVTLTKDYYDMLTQQKELPESLVRRSFEFLLAREPKESILKKFDLALIQKYFLEYENTISS